MKTLLDMMRFFHFIIGVTAPPKEQERLVLFIWIGVVVGFVSLSALLAWFLIPRILH